MLEYLRQRSQSAIIIFFVAIISAVFIINFGPQSQGCGSEGTIWLARVYGKELNISDYRWVERLIKYRYRLPREYVEGGRFATDILDGLVERELLAHSARQNGLAVGEEDVRVAVVDQGQVHFSWPAGSIIPIRGPVRTDFRDDEGVFQAEDFREYIHGLQLSEKAFAEQQATDILAERFRQLVEVAVQISEEELWAEYSRFSDRVNLQYVRVFPAFFRDALRPTTADLETWATDHTDEISKLYEADRFRYRNVRKQLRVQDITVRLDEDSSEEESTARLARAKAIQSLVAAPEADFGLLARCFSDDPQGAAKGGDLGYLRKGMSRFGQEFDDAVFALEVGATSDVITTKRGLHIVKILDQREGDVELDQARLEIAEKLYRTKRGGDRAREVIESIRTLVTKGTDFDESLLAGIVELQPEECPQLPGVEVAETTEGTTSPAEESRRKALQPVIRETGFFNRSGVVIPGIGESTKLMSIAFELTEEHPVAEEILEIREDLFIVRLAEDGRQEPTREEFERERPSYERRLLERKRREALRIFLQRLRREAEAENEIILNDEGIRFISRGRGEESGEGEAAEGEPSPTSGSGERPRPQQEDEGDNE